MINGFPLDPIALQLKQWGCNIEEVQNGVSWNLPTGVSSIVLESSPTESIEGGFIMGVARFVHTLAPSYADFITNRISAAANQLASSSSLIPDADGASPTIVSRVTLYEGDEEMWNLRYAPMLCTEAYMQPNVLLNDMHQWNLQPEQLGLSDFDISTPFSSSDFNDAKDWCESLGLVANSGDDGLTAELPWDRGALSSMFLGFAEAASDQEDEKQFRELSGRTFLLRIMSNTKHACLGNGILATLRLPITIKNADNLAQTVVDLNRWERDSLDAPPFLGSWCADTIFSSPTFAMFLPNELCLPGMPRTITAWMGSRSWRARLFLQQRKND